MSASVSAARHHLTRMAIAGILAAALASGAARAKDLNGKVGVGLEQSLGGVSGLTVRYWPLAEFGIAGTIGAEILVPPSNAGRNVGTRIVASLGGLYNFPRSTHANLGAGLRLAVGFNSKDFEAAVNDSGEASADKVQFIIEIPLAVEFFLSDNFSITFSTGILISIVPDTGHTLEPAGHGNTNMPSVDIGIGTGSVAATLGIVYYF